MDGIDFFSINGKKGITLAHRFFPEKITMLLYRNRCLISTFVLKVEATRNSSHKRYRPESHTRNIFISGFMAYRAVIRTTIWTSYD